MKVAMDCSRKVSLTEVRVASHASAYLHNGMLRQCIHCRCYRRARRAGSLGSRLGSRSRPRDDGGEPRPLPAMRATFYPGT